MKDFPISSIPDALYAGAVFLRDMRRLNDGRFINVGGDATNDSAVRACLIGGETDKNLNKPSYY